MQYSRCVRLHACFRRGIGLPGLDIADAKSCDQFIADSHSAWHLESACVRSLCGRASHEIAENSTPQFDFAP